MTQPDPLYKRADHIIRSDLSTVHCQPYLKHILLIFAYSCKLIMIEEDLDFQLVKRIVKSLSWPDWFVPASPRISPSGVCHLLVYLFPESEHRIGKGSHCSPLGKRVILGWGALSCEESNRWVILRWRAPMHVTSGGGSVVVVVSTDTPPPTQKKRKFEDLLRGIETNCCFLFELLFHFSVCRKVPTHCIPFNFHHLNHQNFLSAHKK